MRNAAGALSEVVRQDLGGLLDCERARYVISCCIGHSQEHVCNQRGLNYKANKEFTNVDAKEAPRRGLYLSENPTTECYCLVVLNIIKQNSILFRLVATR